MSTDQIKVLTHHNLSNGEHWFQHEAYGKKQIDGIKDPEDGETKIAPTSIPSPFAAIDLLRGAFKRLADNELKGTKIDLKLVSDCLDLGELLFDSDLLKFDSNSKSEILKIITWDKRTDLQRLLDSSIEGHRRLGEALKLYIEQDANVYNFDKFEQLFIVKYKNQFLGGISPVTLFFTSTNDLSFAQIRRPNGDILFDESYMHLYERDKEFQLALFALQKSMPKFNTLYKDFANYLDVNRKILRKNDEDFYRVVEELTAEDYVTKFDSLLFGEAKQKVTILNGFVLRKRKELLAEMKEGISSDFEIASSKLKNTIKPLVLKRAHDGISMRGEKMIYFSYPFSSEISNLIPFTNPINIAERELPGISGVKYPYLLLDDFLQPYLVRLIYPINASKYFDGHYTKSKVERGFLLPVKETYFDYFNVEDLLNGITEDGKRYFEIEEKEKGIFNAILRIPIKKGYITFERQYFPSTNSNEAIPEITNNINKGALVERHFTVGIFPFIKCPVDISPIYRVLVVDCDDLPETRNNDYQISFFNEQNQKLEIPEGLPILRGEKNKTGLSTTKIYPVEYNFNYLSISDGKKINGLVVPKFPEYRRTNLDFHFAVDFGTTNTHIEFINSESPSPVPFEIDDTKAQTATLHDRSVRNDPRFDYMYGFINTQDIVEKPERLFTDRMGEKFEFKFPQRTVLAERRNLNFNSSTFAIGDFNIPFEYGYRKVIDQETLINTNLKWSNYEMGIQDLRRIEAFFENLLLMIRAKVLINGGVLGNTKLTWFYPTSMNSGRIDKLEDSWDNLFQKYINGHKTIKVSESVAPFYYYKGKKGVSASDKPVMAIDIGGGTTDVVIFINNVPQLITSFKFAANTIFGDGYSEYGKAESNGFIQKTEKEILSILKANSLTSLIGVYDSILRSQRSEDIIAFFFSLEKNKDFLQKNPDRNFSQILSQDSELRYVFLIFYLAIIYHVVKLAKQKNIEPPRYITFSGNGSKMLSYISTKNTRLASLAEEVISEIYNGTYDLSNYRLDIEREVEKPKEATCKGGLMLDGNPASDKDIEKIKYFLLGTTDALQKELTETNGENHKYTFEEINNEILDSVVGEVKYFFDLVERIHDRFPFDEKLNISSKVIGKGFDKIKYDLRSYLNTGLKKAEKERQGTKKVLNETLFFYPLIEAIFVIASDIAKDKDK